MPAASSNHKGALIFGNQRHSVEEAANRLVENALGDAPREFALHRFDAQELLRPGPAEAAHQGVDEFQIACQTVPFLAESYVVRLDHLERVKLPARAAENMSRALEALRVHRVSWEGRGIWGEAADLPPTEPKEAEAGVMNWVRDVAPLPEGRVLLELAADAPDFFLPGDGGRKVGGLKEFLRAKVKGKIVFADETAADEEAAEGEPASASGRLHRLLEKFIESPPPGCHLVLTAEGKEGDISAPLLRLLKRHGRVEKFVTYDDFAPADWVRKQARARGLELSRPAQEQILRLVGNDLALLASELDKLALLFPPGASPDEEALLAALHGNSRHSLFQITDSLGAKHLEGALSVLEQFLRESPNEHPVLIGILARYFRQLAHVHALQKSGAGEGGLAAGLKLPPFIARKLAAQAQRFSTVELERLLRALAELDVALKQNTRLAPVLFRELLMAICAGRFQKADGGARPLQYPGKVGMS